MAEFMTLPPLKKSNIWINVASGNRHSCKIARSCKNHIGAVRFGANRPLWNRLVPRCNGVRIEDPSLRLRSPLLRHGWRSVFINWLVVHDVISLYYACAGRPTIRAAEERRGPAGLYRESASDLAVERPSPSDCRSLSLFGLSERLLI